MKKIENDSKDSSQRKPILDFGSQHRDCSINIERASKLREGFASARVFYIGLTREY